MVQPIPPVTWTVTYETSAGVQAATVMAPGYALAGDGRFLEFGDERGDVVWAVRTDAVVVVARNPAP